jgi:hypothetical protein
MWDSTIDERFPPYEGDLRWCEDCQFEEVWDGDRWAPVSDYYSPGSHAPKIPEKREVYLKEWFRKYEDY